MFSKSRPSPGDGPASGSTQQPTRPNRDSATKGSSFSVIGDGIVITGNIDAEVDLHIDGKVVGDIRCAALVQGPSSVIEGSIIADSANLSGIVEGSIEARTLMIAASARIMGDILYDSIQIDQGGHVEGQFRHRSAAGKQSKTAPPVKEAPASASDGEATADMLSLPVGGAKAGGAR